MEYPFRNKFLTDIPGEIWKEIDGFNDSYMVSSYGRIKSVDRYVNHKSGKPLLIKGKIISQTIYKFRNKTTNDDIIALRTALSEENKRYDFQVRRLVYQAFIGPLQQGLYVVNIDGDGFNNSVDNLKMISKSDKQQRSIKRNRQIPSLIYLDRSKFKKTYGGYSRQKPIGQYDKDGNLINEFPSIAEACRQTGCEDKSIIKVARGKWSHHHGFVWRYL